MNAPDWHTLETFDAIGVFDPNGSEAEGHLHLFGAMLRVALLCAGTPLDLRERMVIRRSARRAAYKILRGLEAMMRLILLLLAARDPRPLDPCLKRSPRGPARGITAMGFERTKHFFTPLGAALPVRFALSPPAPWRGSSFLSQAGKRPVTRAPEPDDFFANASPLAARLEALTRVYRDPMAYVMRLRQDLAHFQGREANGLCMRILKQCRIDPIAASATSEVQSAALESLPRLFAPPG